MATLLYRLARSCAQHRRLVVVLWFVLVAALGGSFAGIGSSLSGNLSIPGTESQRALDALAHDFPAAAGARGTIVFAAPQGSTLTTPQARRAITAVTKEAASLPGIVAASDPYTAHTVSPDGRHALMSVQFTRPAPELSPDQVAAYMAVGGAAQRAGIRVEHGGDVETTAVSLGGGEAVGVAVALLVLLVTFGSMIAAGMTMLGALVGVGTGMVGVMLLSNVFDMTSTAPILALMLGLAVGIDYSLFITSRHRQHLAEGLEPQEAAARAVGTAGSAVVFAGLTVIIALSALSVVGIPFLSVMGLAAAGTVGVAVLVALTLLPALLGFAGRRLTPRDRRGGRGRRGPRGRHEKQRGAAPSESFGFRWARAITRRRIVVIVLAVAGLGVVAVPVLDMRLALPDGSSAAAGSEKRQAYDLVSQGFGPGYNGQLALVVFGDSPQRTGAVADDVAAAVAAIDGVVAVAPPQASRAGSTAVIGILPRSGPTSQETSTLVGTIRDAIAPIAAADHADVALTGSTAVGVDVSEKLTRAMPLYLGIVIGLSFVLLALVFRSILVPLKATLGFLLTVGASFGATVAMFQWGWLGHLLGLDGTGPLVSFLPILLIGILFGLAMDYEVFLVSRMREDFVHGADAQQATVSGMGNGARVVTAAAIIMISVFSGFIVVDDTIIKSIGFALAFGVLVDAFVVRMVIVPAVMSLLGRTAWWLPGWLDRILPNVDIEGERLRARLHGPSLLGDTGEVTGGQAGSDGFAGSPAAGSHAAGSHAAGSRVTGGGIKGGQVAGGGVIAGEPGVPPDELVGSGHPG